MKALRKKTILKKALLAGIFLLILSISFSPLFSQPELAHATSTTPGIFTPDAELPKEEGINFLGVTDSIRWGSCGPDPLCGVVKGLRHIILGLLTALGSFFAFLLTTAAGFLKIMVFLASQVTLLPLVSIGFGLTLSFTNILFILAIIIMAFATILRFEKWSAKTLLKRLIIAAVLVNFSFFIAGFILDATNVFTGVFSEAFDERELGKAINPQQIILAFGAKVDNIRYADGTVIDGDRAAAELKSVQAGKIDKRIVGFQMPLNQDDWGQFFTIFQGLLLAVVLTFLLMVALFTVGIMVLVRSLYIAFLLILMPIIWPISVLPVLKERWDQWWASFIKWAIYLPSVSFFLWLAVKSTQVMNDLGANNVASQMKQLASNSGATGSGTALILLMIFQSLFIVGLVIAGLVVAKKSSIYGAGVGLMAAGWVGGKVKGGSKKFGKYAVKNPGKVVTAAATVVGTPALGAAVGAGLGLGQKGLKGAAGAGKRMGRGAARIGSETFGKLATTESKFGALGRLATGTVTRGGAQEASNKLAAKANAAAEVARVQKERWESSTDDQIKKALQGPLPKGMLTRASLLQEAAKRKLEGEVSDENAEALAKATEKAYNVTSAEDAPAGEGSPGVKGMINAKPELAARLKGLDPKTEDGQKEIRKAVSKLSGADALKIKKYDTNTVIALSPQAVRFVITRGSEVQKKGIKDAIDAGLPEELQKSLSQVTSQLEDLDDMIDIAKKNGNADALKRAKQTKRDALAKLDSTLTPEQKSLYKKSRMINQAEIGDFGDLNT